MGDHEPGVEAAVLDEEGGQLAVRGVAQPLNPPLAIKVMFNNKIFVMFLIAPHGYKMYDVCVTS